MAAAPCCRLGKHRRGLPLRVGSQGIFGYLIPRLLSGELHPHLQRDARATTGNYSVFTIPFKLELLGLDMDGWKTARRVSAVYTDLILGLTILASRQRQRPGEQAIMWLAVLSLATLRNIGAPPYVLCNVFWLISLMAGASARPSGPPLPPPRGRAHR